MKVNRNGWKPDNLESRADGLNTEHKRAKGIMNDFQFCDQSNWQDKIATCYDNEDHGGRKGMEIRNSALNALGLKCL